MVQANAERLIIRVGGIFMSWKKCLKSFLEGAFSLCQIVSKQELKILKLFIEGASDVIFQMTLKCLMIH